MVRERGVCWFDPFWFLPQAPATVLECSYAHTNAHVSTDPHASYLLKKFKICNPPVHAALRLSSRQKEGATTWVRPTASAGEGGSSASSLPEGWEAVTHAATGE